MAQDVNVDEEQVLSLDDQERVAAADGGFVFIMGLETIQPIGDAPGAGLVAGQTIQRRFTNVWKNEEGTWRLFLRHANVIPIR
jgi:hypothetical protein